MAIPKFPLIPRGASEKTVEVHGIRSTYWEMGTGEPLVFTHGIGPGADGISNWYPVMPLFAERGYRVIVTNMLGFGSGDYPLPGEGTYPNRPFRYTMEARRRHLLGYLDALGLERACLIGNSGGGGISLGVAMLAPERVRRLLLMGSAGLALDMNVGSASLMTSYEPTFENMREILRGLNGGFPIPDEEAHVRYRYELTLHEPHLRAYKDTMNLFVSDPMQSYVWREDDIRGVKVPTLLIHGREDPVTTTEYGVRYHRLLERSSLISLPRCGHWVMVRYPKAFTELAIWFLETDSLEQRQA